MERRRCCEVAAGSWHEKQGEQGAACGLVKGVPTTRGRDSHQRPAFETRARDQSLRPEPATRAGDPRSRPWLAASLTTVPALAARMAVSSMLITPVGSHCQ